MQFNPEIEISFDAVAVKSEATIRAELNDLAGKLADVLNNDKPIEANDAAYLHALLTYIAEKAAKPAKAPKVHTAERTAAKRAAKTVKAEKVVKIAERETVDAGFDFSEAKAA